MASRATPSQGYSLAGWNKNARDIEARGSCNDRSRVQDNCLGTVGFHRQILALQTDMEGGEIDTISNPS